MLFVPFKELKNRIGLMKPENDNIGLGLSCSYEICRKIGGDIKLLESKNGFTAIAFKIPVKKGQ
jgi:C4-dicarboxylate-specific signal transduction histidine kinase